mmetsp:Transcript_41801/g.135247  ORF Transcript_41801/g.135247 Transcript_41801/m.135247 type:complete len:417 (+) Transcript_41801:53-1303(+)
MHYPPRGRRPISTSSGSPSLGGRRPSANRVRAGSAVSMLCRILVDIVGKDVVVVFPADNEHILLFGLANLAAALRVGLAAALQVLALLELAIVDRRLVGVRQEGTLAWSPQVHEHGERGHVVDLRRTVAPESVAGRRGRLPPGLVDDLHHENRQRGEEGEHDDHGHPLELAQALDLVQLLAAAHGGGQRAENPARDAADHQDHRHRGHQNNLVAEGEDVPLRDDAIRRHGAHAQEAGDDDNLPLCARLQGGVGHAQTQGDGQQHGRRVQRLEAGECLGQAVGQVGIARGVRHRQSHEPRHRARQPDGGGHGDDEVHGVLEVFPKHQDAKPTQYDDSVEDTATPVERHPAILVATQEAVGIFDDHRPGQDQALALATVGDREGIHTCFGQLDAAGLRGAFRELHCAHLRLGLAVLQS